MPLRIHALVVRVVEPLLCRVCRVLCVACTHRAAAKQTHASANCGTFTAANQPADRRAQDCADYGAANCCVSRSIIRRSTSRLHRILPTRFIVEPKLIEAL